MVIIIRYIGWAFFDGHPQYESVIFIFIWNSVVVRCDPKRPMEIQLSYSKKGEKIKRGVELLQSEIMK
jgi:hypothetical protein